jgi:hypothetical protein
MKKIIKFLLYFIGAFLGLIVMIVFTMVLWITISGNQTAKKSMALAGPEVKTLTIDGFSFRDLNKNGKMQ